MSRFVACRNLEGKVISSSQCDPATKPLAVHPCGDKNCPAHWVEQEWDQVKPSPALLSTHVSHRMWWKLGSLGRAQLHSVTSRRGSVSLPQLL